MTQVIDALATWLHTQGLATLGTNLFKGNAPDTNADIIVITDTGGFPNQLDSTGYGVEVVRVQVMARYKRQEKGRDKLYEIQAALHNATRIDLGDYVILSAQAEDRPAVAGRDPLERWMLVLNLALRVRED